MPLLVSVKPASYAEDHKTRVKISRESSFTKAFSEVRYLQDYYRNGWVGKLQLKFSGEWVTIGFVLLRHCLRRPYTNLYYLAVKAEHRGKRFGGRLVAWAERNSPHPETRLGVDEANEGGRRYWERLGFNPCNPPFTVSKHGLKILQLRRDNPEWLRLHAQPGGNDAGRTELDHLGRGR